MLAIDRRLLSEEGFSKLQAADNLRLLLSVAPFRSPFLNPDAGSPPKIHPFFGAFRQPFGSPAQRGEGYLEKISQRALGDGLARGPAIVAQRIRFALREQVLKGRRL